MKSLWHGTAKDMRVAHPPIRGDASVDVLIIGGGMAGILCAHRLSERGANYLLVEGDEIGGGTTGNTTAKITAQHGLIHQDIERRFGLAAAAKYLAANQWAIDEYERLSARYPCDFERQNAYTYSVSDRKKLEREAATYRKLHLSGVIRDDLPLPIKTSGAVQMERQAQFHPLRFLYALATPLNIAERTFVMGIDEHTAYTARGRITAKHIVLATHFPLVNIPGLYFLKMFQHRSYVIALENAPDFPGMYVDEADAGYSFRRQGGLLLVGGGDHRTGKQGGGYEAPRALARQAYPGAHEKYAWAAQDCMTLDGMPYIGRHRTGAATLYVATGFHKWGMTSSMVAARVLTDLILDGRSDLEALYNPRRSMWRAQLFANTAHAVGGLGSIGGHRCAHMGCKLKWNPLERTWDCGCHGSRFDEGGHVLENPAKKNIKL